MTDQEKKKDVPEIRFAGFTDPWEQRKLGDFASKRTTKNNSGAITETFTNSAEYGVVSQLDYFDHDITNADSVTSYTVVEGDDFVYNPRISTAAPVGPINRCRLGRAGVMSPLYTIFRADDSIDHVYLEHYFKTDSWHPFMYLEGNSGARSDRFSIGDKTFFEMPIYCPQPAEQAQIASMLETLDSLITLHQRECDPAIGRAFMENAPYLLVAVGSMRKICIRCKFLKREARDCRAEASRPARWVQRQGRCQGCHRCSAFLREEGTPLGRSRC